MKKVLAVVLASAMAMSLAACSGSKPAETTAATVAETKAEAVSYTHLDVYKRQLMSNRKALFFDVDGTLLSERTGLIPESARNALIKARSNGHLIFINSGRTYCNLDEIKRQIEADGYLCGCGTQVIAGDRVIYRYFIDVYKRQPAR